MTPMKTANKTPPTKSKKSASVSPIIKVPEIDTCTRFVEYNRDKSPTRMSLFPPLEDFPPGSYELCHGITEPDYFHYGSEYEEVDDTDSDESTTSSNKFVPINSAPAATPKEEKLKVQRKPEKRQSTKQQKTKIADPQRKPTSVKKRKTTTVPFTNGKLPKLAGSIAKERMRKDRDARSLFVCGFPMGVIEAELKAIHPDIVSVHYQPEWTCAWLMFASSDACIKAFAAVSKVKVKDRELYVDFCGENSPNIQNRAADNVEEVTRCSSKPVNPLELYVTGYPPNTTTEQMKIVFKNCTDVHFPRLSKNKNKRFCFVKFENEADASAAFEEGKNIKIGGNPVDIMYARFKPEKK